MHRKAVIALGIFGILVSTGWDLQAQKSRSDSLFMVMKNFPDDTNKVKTMNLLSLELMNNVPDTSIMLSTRAAKLAEKLQWKKGVASSYGQIGICYRLKADYPKALEYYYKALKIDEEINNKRGIAARLGNIGGIYWHQGENKKALEHYHKALSMYEEVGDKRGISIWLGNIGNAFKEQGENAKALEYYFKTVKLKEELGDKKGLSIQLGNIGVVYDEIGDYEKALKYYNSALEISKDLDDKNGASRSLCNIGALYSTLKKYKEAEKYLLAALAIDQEVGALSDECDDEKNLSVLYERMDRPELALLHYQRHIALRDSITNDENIKKQTQLEMNYKFEKQQAADSIRNAEQVKQEQLKHQQEIQQQQTYTYGGVVGLLLMMVVAGVSFRAYKQKQKTNEIISGQKRLVEEKQKEILDSIQYAKKIQRSLLPTEKYIARKLSEIRNRS